MGPYATPPLSITVIGNEKPAETETMSPTLTPTPTPLLPSTSAATSSPASSRSTKPQLECTLTGPYASETQQYYSIQPGQTLSQDYSIKNIGTTATGAMTASFTLESSQVVRLGIKPVSSLAPSQSTSGKASFAIPAGTPSGDYHPYLTILGSDGSQVYRMYYPRSVHVGSTGGPDLVPLVLTLPPSARSGEPVTLACSVKNTGSAAAGPFQVSFYLLRDRSITSSTPVFATGSVSGLGAGASQQVQATGTAPSSTVVESYLVAARVDPQNSVAESGENNNDIITDSSNMLTIQPNIVADLTGFFGTISTSGGMLTVPYSIRNLGQASASGGILRLVLMDAQSGIETPLTTVNLPVIAALQTYSPSSPFKVSQSTLETGDYYIAGYVSCPGSGQSSEKRFITQSTFHITGSGKKPDFSVDVYKSPSEAKAGDVVTLQDMAYTSIDGPESGPVTIRYYLSSDTVITSSDPVIASRTISLLKPNQPDSGSVQATIPSGTATGTYYFGAIIDPDNTIPEKNEDNNADSTPRSVQITGAEAEPLIAAFDMSPESGQAPLTVQFTDRSSGGPESGSWDFGDGTTSIEPSPSHTYTKTGSYTVTQTVKKGTQKDTETKTVTVTGPVAEPLKAAFDMNPSTGPAPLTIQFTDQSDGDIISYSWDMGDGEQSTEENPKHIYSKAGTYTVTLTINSQSGETDQATRTVTVSGGEPSLKAGFTYAPKGGADPLVMVFTDTSTGDVASYRWDFGDGSSSTQRNPEQVYTKAGTYTVTLTVSNAAGSDTVSQQVTVTGDDTGSGDLVASFTMSPESGSAPLTVFFTDTSTGPAVKRVWIFNDKDPKPLEFGGVNTQRANQYTEPGTYQVTLTITDASGKTNTATRTVTVTSGYEYGAGDITVSPSCPSSADPGDPLDISVSVRYQGNADTPPAVFLRIVISEDNTIALQPGASDFSVYEGSIIQFSPGETQKTVPISIVLPGTLTPGKTYYIGVQVLNNVAGGSIEATGSCPVTMNKAEGPAGSEKNLDFTVSLSGAGTTKPGSAYISDVTVSNKGTDFMYPVDVSLYLSTDQEYQPGQDTYLANSPGFGPQPGNSHGQTRDLVIPASVSPGSYYLIGVVNEKKTLTETDYSNNIAVKPLMISEPVISMGKPGAVPPEKTPTPTPTPTQTPELTPTPTPTPTVAPDADEMFACEVTEIAGYYRGDQRLFFTISPSGTVQGTMTGHGVVSSDKYTDSIDGSGSVSGSYDSSTGKVSFDGYSSGRWITGGEYARIHWLFDGQRSGDTITGTQISEDEAGGTCSRMTRTITIHKVSSPGESVPKVTYSYNQNSCSWA